MAGSESAGDPTRTGPHGPAQVLYHVIRRAAPEPADFACMLARGRILQKSDEAASLRLAAGVSCFQTAEQARRQAVRFPRLGRFVAELDLSDDGCFVERVRSTPAEGHYTVWASADYLLSRVVKIEPV